MLRKEDILNTEAVIDNLQIAIRKLKEIALFNDISFEIAYSSDLSRIFFSIIQTAKELTESECGFIAMVDRSGRLLDVKAEFGLKKLKRAGRRFEIGKTGVIGRTANLKIIQNVPNVKEDDDYVKYFPGINSELAVPLLNKGQLVGIINLESIELNHYEKYHEEVIIRLSSLAVITIERILQYDDLLLNKNVIQLLNVVDRSIIDPNSDLENTLNLILKGGLKLIGADIGFIQLVDEITEELYISVYTEAPLDKKKIRYKIGKEGITGYVARNLKTLIINDVTLKPIQIDGLTIEYIPFFKNIGSEMTVPLTIRDRLIGIFDANSIKTGFFNEEKKDIIEKLAIQAAISIENYRNRKSIDQNKIFETIESTTSALTHWLKNRLLSFGESLKRIESQIEKERRLSIESKDAIKDELSMLWDIFNQMDNLCKGTLFTFKESKHQMIDLPGYLENKRKQFGFPSDITVELRYPSKRLPKLSIDVPNFDVAFDNILKNALEAMEEKESKTITIQCEIYETDKVDGKKVRVSISDTGKGIATEDIHKIFRLLYSDKVGGTGIGLYVTHKILKKLGFSINLKSDINIGTTFIIDIPLTA
ncbi:MAG: GAF domain-containing sensor histidine kinase [Desulfobacteraceae bacterium]|nr:GAF domain-containing sensor histidine kinase [Desulfobacteraceae bacterium]